MVSKSEATEVLILVSAKMCQCTKTLANSSCKACATAELQELQIFQRKMADLDLDRLLQLVDRQTLESLSEDLKDKSVSTISTITTAHATRFMPNF